MPGAGAGPPPDSFTGYKIVKEIHRGGQGVVYQAIHESTKRKVAIKVMRERPFAGSSDRARFDREVQILGQLQHPYIVGIHDTGLAGGSHFFIMDYISGQPLDVYMASPGAPGRSVDETLRLFQKICQAINAAHLRGIIHRDLKPSNIRIDQQGDPHVLDFGLAKVATTADEASVMTVTGEFVGSFPWASPEQAEGIPSKIDVRTDVYSLGVVLYQMLTGKFPYEIRGSVRDVLDRIVTAEPIPPRTLRRAINDEVETIVLKCLQKERDRRYQSAGELARDVQHYCNGEPIEAKRDSLGYMVRKQLRKYRVPVAIAAILFVVVTAGLVTSLLFWQQAALQRDAAVEAREQQKREAAKSDAVSRFLQDMLASVSPWEQGKDVSVREVLDAAAEKLSGEFVDQPLVRAQLHRTIGETYLPPG
ncbi:MAG: serine/threonine protein kinase [Planctomycetes bacterium]|nr:serine/threonine protein kinase [Planctomycetota bacterium]